MDLQRNREDTMAQTSILGRIGQLIRANVNSILDGPRTRRRCSTS